jgi:hypothetical protein
VEAVQPRPNLGDGICVDIRNARSKALAGHKLSLVPQPWVSDRQRTSTPSLLFFAQRLFQVVTFAPLFLLLRLAVAGMFIENVTEARHHLNREEVCKQKPGHDDE